MISIIIPTLSERKLIEQALRQFNGELKKKYRLEVIVSDGGSDDGTIKIAEQLADKLVVHNIDSRQTIAAGRNAGAKEASGDILFFTNADTLIPNPDLFFAHVGELLNNPAILALTCYVRVYPEDETLSDKLFHSSLNIFFDLVNTVGIGMGRGECHVIRKSIFDELGGYKETLVAGEDFELFSRIRRKGKIKFMRDLFVYESPRRYRQWGYPRVAFDWFRNAVAVKLLKRSVIEEWKPIR